MAWFLLLGILGLFTYFTVQRSVATITRTPVWLLWLVLMTPALIWTGWILMKGEEAQIPTILLLGPFVLCPILYWFLIQWGRPVSPPPSETLTSTPETIPIPPASLDPKGIIKPINREEEATLHTCFPWTVYYLQNVEYRPQALICRGQLRASPEVAYQTIRENIEMRFGDRFLVIFQEGGNGKPFFALVPNVQARRGDAAKRSDGRPIVALVLSALTLLTCTLGGIVLLGKTAEELPGDASVLLLGLPYGLALMTILGIHEMAHYLAARRNGMRATLPYFIPVPPTGVFPFGTFGAFIQMRSPVPDRKALFDVGIAGPMAGFLASLPFLFWGLAHSTVVDRTETSSILNFNSFDPQSSLLLAILSRLALGGQLAAQQTIDLHPVAIAGCIGIVITALNLMPVGQLDGGHIVHAMFGQRMGATIGQIARLLVLFISFVQQEFLLWAILLLFIPAMDEPALNDVSELDNRRDFFGLLALTVLVVIILPVPPLMTRLLF
ncbi:MULTISPECIES: site-2 protease family protein [unclassified Leptolyngbya]|uniref:site-2 protease family protein n=1 Tax=unclassified Leptolyngbya TaxID=2650499 RepID=UPI001684FCDE|nr:MULTISPECIES: site-2 protease family protein [unclassified Leptolyngbya]MBD1911983.1 site-2 protease family protein [Leptolyngbya sp. FACHB-8]MBD2155353.1 site-2 protease family protein [Leptolyngbya sp. FACHB-16]